MKSIRLNVFCLFASLVAVLTAAGCVRVKPYERGVLAHPTMVTGQVTGPGEDHMQSVQEGAIGGEGAGGGGCGCN
jgi:Domain of unknown function (DUF4266)